MFHRKPKPTSIEEVEYKRLYEELSFYEPYQKKYARIMDQLERHKKLQGTYRPEKKSVSPETWATIGANLISIFAILSYEQAHMITSKALSFVRKP